MKPLSHEIGIEAEPFIWKGTRILKMLTNKKSVKSFCKNFNPYEKEKTRGSMMSFTGL